MIPLPPRWRFALKPASWPKLMAPTVLGQALGGAHRGGIDIALAAASVVSTALLLVAIVCLNDYADREIDGLKRRLFPQSSKKTIPDGILPAYKLLFVGALSAVGYIAFAFFCESWAHRPGYGWASVLALGLFIAYSLPPFRLNYRGGGELFEMIGVGFVLPWLGAYFQGGLGAETVAWLPRASAVLGGTTLLALASAIASGLSDEVSDRKGGKRTFVSTFGNRAGRKVVECLMLATPIAWILAAAVSTHIPWLTVLLPSAFILYRYARLRPLSGAATTGQFPALSRYKTELHLGIWRSTELLGASLLLHRLFLA